tara:strand:- start:4 stop:939 length:936 start_codon:yes stop_codon:yes gene_type:complete
MNFIERIAKEYSLPREKLSYICYQAPYSYKYYKIQKRDGGYRDIYHPSAELKVIQRWLSAKLFSELPLHDAAMAYRKGISIRSNAEAHSMSNFILRMDFKNFFPSIKRDDLTRFFVDKRCLLGITEEEALQLSRVVSIKDGDDYYLPIGAPSSPVLANAIMYDIDVSVSKYCAKNSIFYTRYADDLTFSTKKVDVLKYIPRVVEGILRDEKYPTLSLNHKKTSFSSKKRTRRVTGVKITPEGNLSVGRDLKRKIRTMVYLHLKGELEVSDLSTLSGLISYVNSIEPDFIERLASKYGLNEIYGILGKNVSR